MMALQKVVDFVKNQHPDGRLVLQVVKGWSPREIVQTPRQMFGRKYETPYFLMDDEPTIRIPFHRKMDRRKQKNYRESQSIVDLNLSQGKSSPVLTRGHVYSKKPFHEKSMEEIMHARYRATLFHSALHKAGRALDMRLLDMQRKVPFQNIAGNLAQLAYYSGDFDWCTVKPNYIVHCSVGPDPFYQSDDQMLRFGCFPNDANICHPTGKCIHMKHLKLGDEILTLNQIGTVQTTKVIGFMHRINLTKSILVNIILSMNSTDNTEKKNHLSLTPNHLVYRIDKFGKHSTVFASSISIGDKLMLVHDNVSMTADVETVEIKQVENIELIAPLTDSGSMIVNNIYTSCYAQVNLPALIHFAFLPLRLWHRYNCVNNNYTTNATPEENFVHPYVDLLIRLCAAFIPSNFLFSF